jgi:hypothetical protein
MISILNTLYSTVVRSVRDDLVGGLFSILQGRSTFFENESDSKELVEKFKTEGVLGKASILLTPTGYSSGVIHNVKPSSSPFGDLTKAGGTVATRVNSSGLIETATNNTPRIDYAIGSGAILVEPASTNFLKYSEDFTARAGVGSLANATVTSNATTDPTGGNNGDLVTLVPNSYANKNIVMSGNELTYSIYLKSPTVAGTYPLNWYDGSHHRQLVNVTTEWQRVQITFTPNAGPASGRFVYFGDNRGGLGETLSSVYVWGGQVEEKGYASSYIPTTSTTITRSAESYLDGGDVSLINSPAGVLFVERQCFDSGTNDWILLTATGEDETTSVGIYGSSSGSNSGRVKTSASTEYIGFGGLKTDMTKLALKWDGTTIKTFKDGALIQTAALSGGFTANQLTELNLSTGQGFNGRLKQLAVFNEALADAEIVALTS